MMRVCEAMKNYEGNVAFQECQNPGNTRANANLHQASLSTAPVGGEFWSGFWTAVTAHDNKGPFRLKKRTWISCDDRSHQEDGRALSTKRVALLKTSPPDEYPHHSGNPPRCLTIHDSLMGESHHDHQSARLRIALLYKGQSASIQTTNGLVHHERYEWQCYQPRSKVLITMAHQGCVHLHRLEGFFQSTAIITAGSDDLWLKKTHEGLSLEEMSRALCDALQLEDDKHDAENYLFPGRFRLGYEETSSMQVDRLGRQPNY